MTIHKLDKLRNKKPFLDLSGPDGNAMMLLGYAKTYAKQLGKDFDDIHKRMTASDYDNLVKVFDEEFGEYIDLYR